MLNWIPTELLYLLAFLWGGFLFFVATWQLYIAVMGLKRVRHDLHPFAKVCAYVVLIHALPMDVLFNWILGSIFFLEPPREFLFTDRLQRHKAKSRGWRQDLAYWFCEHMLNQFDPSPRGHC